MSSINPASGVPAFLSAIDSARQGIDSGLQTFAAAAQAVAAGTVQGTGAAPAAVVDQLVARQQVEAAAKVFSTADQMVGTLLNLRA